MVITIASALVACLILGSARNARALTKDECIDAHSKGQDAREKGQLSLARKLFLTCAQAACPGLVQGDCARFSDDLDRLQPSVSFGARDTEGADLPDTTVYVDGVLTATHLDDGKLHDIDPGHHTLRFLNGGHEVTVTIVLNQGERGRMAVATFPAPQRARASANAVAGTPAQPEAHRPLAPLFLAGAGLVMTATGATIGIVGLNKVPPSCSTSSRECAAPPGDKVFDDAKSGIALANAGLVVAVTGFVAMAAGLVWYASSPQSVQTGKLVTPWLTANGGGIAVSGTL